MRAAWDSSSSEDKQRRKDCGATAFGQLEPEIQSAIIDEGIRGSRYHMDRRTEQQIESMRDAGRFSLAQKTDEELANIRESQLAGLKRGHETMTEVAEEW